jgi:CRP-like cAMP-binding protein
MYFLQNLGSEVDALNTRAKELVQAMCERIEPLQKKVKIPSRQDVFAAPERQGKLFRLLDGNLSYARADKVLFYFDPGDLIGVEQAIIGTSAKVLTDFAVVVDVYDATTFLDAAHDNPELNRLWTEYLATSHGMLSNLAGNLFKEEITTPPDINGFQPGATITEQGSRASEVFLLIEGLADVLVDGAPAGTIKGGELFGMVPALTGIPRTATVVAAEPCMVMSVPKENFVHLVETRPSNYLKMVEDMARLMVDLGDQAFSLKISNF